MDRNTSENTSAPIHFHLEDLTETTLPGKLITVFTVVDVAMILVILSTMAIVRDRKINRERHPVFLPFRPPRGFRLYAVLIETGHSPAGGTSSKVFLRIIGKFTKTPGFSLICTSRQRRHGGSRLFRSQNKDIFILSIPHYLGEIEAFEVMTDRQGDSPPWFLKSIRLLSLDNYKCWKSNVGAWLRGDGRPYFIKASLAGGLSTKNYFFKIFFQNHFWTYAWVRPLGSSFTCFQRTMLQWTNVGISLGLAHAFLYQDGLLENIRSQTLTIPSYTPVDITISALVSSALGVWIGSIFRFSVQLLTGGTKQERVDDKDDFSHLIGPGRLKYDDGAVIRFSGVKIKEPDIKKEEGAKNFLTQEQMKLVMHIMECQEANCTLRNILNNPECEAGLNCCYSRKETPVFASSQQSALQMSSSDSFEDAATVEEDVFEDVAVQEEESEIFENAFMQDEKSEIFENAFMQEKKSEIFENAFLKDVESDVFEDTSTTKETPNMYASIPEIIKTSPSDSTPESTSSSSSSSSSIEIQATNHSQNDDCCECEGQCFYENIKITKKSLSTKQKQKKSSKIRYRTRDSEDSECEVCHNGKCIYENDKVPHGSARAISNKKQSSSSIEEEKSNDFSLHVSMGPEKKIADSLSEPDSDEEIITKSARTEVQGNRVRRPENIYAISPLWHDQYHVWIESPQGGSQHHKAMRRRYAVTNEQTLYLDERSKFLPVLDRIIYYYLIQEQVSPPGVVNLPGTLLATLVAVLGAFSGVLAAAFAVYQRVFVSNADTVIYLYAVMFSLLCNVVLTSTMNALFWAFVSTCMRRRHILKKRKRNQ